MSAPFDPYYQWLSIPPEEQPANFYRLLGVKVFESNLEVIASAADRQTAHVKTFVSGPQGVFAQRLLGELTNARTMLLDAKRKPAYDAMLRAAAADEEQSQAAIAKGPQLDLPAAQGKTFGDYLILHVISHGATGTTFKAQRRTDGQIVSLKVIPKELAKSEDFLKRLKREFDVSKGFSHPNVVTAYELGEFQGRPFLVFEYVGGADLSRVVTDHGPLDVPAAIETAKRLAEGLVYLHRKGIVHRNLKPQNVLVNVQGAVKIAGLTMAMEDDAHAFLGGHEMNLTVTGEIVGSPDYMAPEQAADAHRVDGRADLYSLGCTLHYLLTGKPPFTGKNAMQKIAAHKNAPIPSLRTARPDVPEWLDGLYQKMLAKSTVDRPANADAVVGALEGRVEKKINMVAVIAAGAAAVVVIFLIVLAVLSTR